MDEIKVYEVKENIPYEEITKVLNEAYEELLQKNLKYAATRQNTEKTRDRIKGGTCLIAEKNGKIVGTVTYHIREKRPGAKWYIDGKYVTFSQLGILPEYRKDNILIYMGKYLMRTVFRDKELSCVLLDTSEEAEHLVKQYVAFGMQIVDYISWRGTNYYSYVFRKEVNGKKFDDDFCKRKLKIAKIKCRLQFKVDGNKTILGKFSNLIKK